MKLIYVEKEGGPYRVSGDLTWDEYMKVLETGVLGSSELCAIEVWQQFDPKKLPNRVLLFDFIIQRTGVPHISCYRFASPEANALR